MKLYGYGDINCTILSIYIFANIRLLLISPPSDSHTIFYLCMLQNHTFLYGEFSVYLFVQDEDLNNNLSDRSR